MGWDPTARAMSASDKKNPRPDRVANGDRRAKTQAAKQITSLGMIRWIASQHRGSQSLLAARKMVNDPPVGRGADKNAHIALTQVCAI